MATDKTLNKFVINVLDQKQYDSATKNDDELYLIPDAIEGGGSGIGELVLTTAQYQAVMSQGYATLTDDQMSEFTNPQVNVKYNTTELYRMTVNKVLTTSAGSQVYYYYLNAIGSDFELDGGMVKSYASRVDIAKKRIYIGTEKTLISNDLMKTINGVSLYESTPSTNVIDISLSDIGAQPTLVSGTNIKTINNESILGSGNISISGGGGDSAVGTIELTDAQMYSLQTTGKCTLTSDNLSVIKSSKMIDIVYNSTVLITMTVNMMVIPSTIQTTPIFIYHAYAIIWDGANYPKLYRILFSNTSETEQFNLSDKVELMIAESTYLNNESFKTSDDNIYGPQFYVHNILMSYESDSASFQVRFQITNNQSDTYNSLSYLTGYLGTAFVQGCTGYANNGTYGQAYSVTPSKVYAIIDGAQATIDYTTTGLTITDTIKEMS